MEEYTITYLVTALLYNIFTDQTKKLKNHVINKTVTKSMPTTLIVSQDEFLDEQLVDKAALVDIPRCLLPSYLTFYTSHLSLLKDIPLQGLMKCCLHGTAAKDPCTHPTVLSGTLVYVASS